MPRLSILFFLTACFLPCLIFDTRHFDGRNWISDGHRSVNGFTLLFQGLAFGWMGLNFAAFANIPLGVGWICSLQGHYNCARKCTVIAALLALQTMQLLLQDQADLFAYANGRAHFVGPHIGFFFWFASILLIWREPRIPPADREMFTLKI